MPVSSPQPPGAVPHSDRDLPRLLVLPRQTDPRGNCRSSGCVQGAARAYLDEAAPMHTSNNDEVRYPDKRASFAKTLPHDDVGEVDVEAFNRFVAILTSGEASGFEAIPRDRTAEVELNDPQATYAFDLVGRDSAATALDPAPAFSSARMASEMAEVYWLSLTRDVPFREYAKDSLLAEAVSDLNAFAEPLKSAAGEKLTPVTVFRGETPGDLIGPYLSQLLWLDIPYGIKSLEQRYTVPTRGQSFMTDYSDWLACQRGTRPRSSLHFDATPRFICSARELAEYVHRDFSFQSYMNAALIMLSLGKDALSPTNPYRGSRTQFGDITLGSKNVLSMLAQAALLAQKGAYFHKWQVHRRLRPECFAGRIETQARGQRRYDLHADILNCNGVARVQSLYGTRLLPVAFPEGCPTHPSYPSAHACNAGACATILKASSMQITCCHSRSRRRQTGWHWRRGVAPLSLLATRLTSSPITLRSVAMPPAFTTAPTAFTGCSLASNKRSDCWRTTAALTTSASMVSSAGNSMVTG